MPEIKVKLEDIDVEGMNITFDAEELPTLMREIRRLTAAHILGAVQSQLSLTKVVENGVTWIVVYMELGVKEMPVYAERLDEIGGDTEEEIE